MSHKQAAILGGPKVRTEPFRTRKLIHAEQREAVMRVLDSEQLSGFLGAPGPLFNGGKEVQAFEKACESTFGYKHAITVNSWTTGLQVCVGAVGIEPGDEVICSPFTMSASATCALFYGGIPVFADVEKHSGCLDPESVRARITERTKAIIVVHIFGYPANMDALRAIADEHNIKIIEDAAQAPGTQWKGQTVGALADIGGFSLNYHKHIHTGEGGIIVTNDDELAERCRYIRNHGENVTESFPFENKLGLFGSNYRLTELQAALGSALLPQLEGLIVKRNENAELLDSLLESLPSLTPQKLLNENDRHSYYVYSILYDEDAIGLPRNLFTKAVLAELPETDHWDTIPMIEGYVKPIYWSELYQKKLGLGKQRFPFNMMKSDENYKHGSCPNTESLFKHEQLLSLMPMEANGKKEIIDFSNACEKVIQNATEIKDAFKGKLDASETLLPHEAVNNIQER